MEIEEVTIYLFSNNKNSCNAIHVTCKILAQVPRAHDEGHSKSTFSKLKNRKLEREQECYKDD